MIGQKIEINPRDPKVFVYEIDTSSGQSGAPMMFYESQNDFEQLKHGLIIGVHTGGFVRKNCGTRLVREHFIWMLNILRNRNSRVAEMFRIQNFDQMRINDPEEYKQLQEMMDHQLAMTLNEQFNKGVFEFEMVQFSEFTVRICRR